ncbi:Serine/threonine-protein kinase WNK (With No Lysine)-related [Zea mays]|uniref:Serine/threonine-protein kinase WNK (With No Lysine)-related n=1 Tax=Zea mays TaxID=4577 RepID=A0A1D6N9I4_MAIZE|nr:Serine/threonine-protein kinase WNK (With No Lysine)-related [Zea mays]
MVGSGADGGGGGDDARSKEAAGMMALHEALRNVCLDSDWTYSVFWTIRPRPRCRGGNGCMVGDDNGSLMLMWEDGFCRPRVAECLADMSGGEDPVRKAFIKMSIQLYNYGEGWVLYWVGAVQVQLPPEWTDQFASGIQARELFDSPAEFSFVFIINIVLVTFVFFLSALQTIAVIQAGHGLLQLGSCKIIPEDLHFVLRMRHTFESLGYQSGFFLSQLFSSARGASPTPPPPAARPPPAQLFNWPGAHQPQLFPPGPGAFHHPSARAMPPLFPGGGKDEGHMFHIPPAHHGSKPLHMDELQHRHQQTMGAGGEAPDGELRWPNGLSFFTALTGRDDDAKLLFGGPGAADDEKAAPDAQTGHGGAGNVEEYLSLESHSDKAPSKVENGAQHSTKSKRSFTLPARVSSSTTTSPSVSASTAPQGMEYRGTHEGGVYSDLMETFLE